MCCFRSISDPEQTFVTPGKVKGAQSPKMKPVVFCLLLTPLQRTMVEPIFFTDIVPSSLGMQNLEKTGSLENWLASHPKRQLKGLIVAKDSKGYRKYFALRKSSRSIW